uniref:Uncharacterized protein n=1 Tax=Tanacetum cinerariifolium TaxID=118510 RepID=A0A6L2NNR8_TANCI|nr:hypothetical protein [Tanacetum cinerariifolium]
MQALPTFKTLIRQVVIPDKLHLKITCFGDSAGVCIASGSKQKLKQQLRLETMFDEAFRKSKKMIRILGVPSNAVEVFASFMYSNSGYGYGFPHAGASARSRPPLELLAKHLSEDSLLEKRQSFASAEINTLTKHVRHSSILKKNSLHIEHNFKLI